MPFSQHTFVQSKHMHGNIPIWLIVILCITAGFVECIKKPPGGINK